MTNVARPLRSVLYIPGSKDRALDKARDLPADAIIFDLEDAVAPDEKVAARKTLQTALTAGGYGDRLRLVRVNGLDTEWCAEDVATFRDADIDGILLPKVNGAADVEAVATLAPGMAIWAMMETARGIWKALEIADHPAMAGFILGTNDLVKELGAQVDPARHSIAASLQMALMAARAAGIACVDGVYNAFKDDAGLQDECEHGRALGMDGKTLIHPAQLEIANRVFAPDAAAVDLAKRQIAAYQEAAAQGRGVAVVDGKIVENLHVVTARTILDKAAAIAAKEG